jgi:hypothetical protein
MHFETKRLLLAMLFIDEGQGVQNAIFNATNLHDILIAMKPWLSSTKGCSAARDCGPIILNTVTTRLTHVRNAVVNMHIAEVHDTSLVRVQMVRQAGLLSTKQGVGTAGHDFLVFERKDSTIST